MNIKVAAFTVSEKSINMCVLQLKPDIQLPSKISTFGKYCMNMPCS